MYMHKLTLIHTLTLQVRLSIHFKWALSTAYHTGKNAPELFLTIQHD